MSVPAELTLGGARPMRGRLRLPGDKSISHRALLFAALANGASTITHLATGEDVHATRAALAQLGVKIRERDAVFTVHGGGLDAWSEPDAVLDCGNSGTTMRLLAGALAGRPFLTVLTGDRSLRARPMGRVAHPLRAMGAVVDGRDNGEHAPLVIRGQVLRGMRHQLPVASAQVKSALVLAGLQADGATEVVSPAASRDHTERMLTAMGAPLEHDARRRARPAGRARSRSRSTCPATRRRQRSSWSQPRSRPAPISSSRTCRATRRGSDSSTSWRVWAPTSRFVSRGEVCGEPIGEFHVRASSLRGTTIAGDEIPNVQDEIPALAVAAAFADGVTDIRDAAELAVKESNRIGTLHQELTELGVGVEARPDGLSIRGGKPRAGQMKSHGDHRIAMAMAIAANALDGESVVRGWRVVASSYPEFDEHLAQLTATRR